jgi:hypothetical protein
LRKRKKNQAGLTSHPSQPSRTTAHRPLAQRLPSVEADRPRTNGINRLRGLH